jgi:hypothetical protein
MIKRKSKIKVAMAGQGICNRNGRVAMPWFRQLVASLSLWMTRFNHKPIWDMWPDFSPSTSVFP